MPAGPQSLKEYWNDPKHNRRKSSGRREADYAVCNFHEGQIEEAERARTHVCEKIRAAKAEHEADINNIFSRINQLEDRIVGKWAFGVVIMILLALFGTVSTVNIQLNNEIRSEVRAIRSDMGQSGR